MNANLKELMRSAGYPATEGDNWLATDTKTFQGFAVRELGVPFSQTAHVLAYPQAFPAMLNRLAAMAGVVPEPASAPIVPQTVVEAVQATLPAEPVIEPVAAFDGFDMSAQGQMPKQELEQPNVASTTESADENTESAEGEAAGGEDASESDDEDGATPPADSGSESTEFTEGADEEGADEEAADEATEE